VNSIDEGSDSIKVLRATHPAELERAARLLREGGVVVVPTDTLYALSASIFQRQACGRVFAIKGRPSGHAVPLLLASAADLPLVVKDVPRIAWRLIDTYWPGPLSLVLPARPSVPAQLRGGGETVAVRVPSARSCLELLELIGEPIIGTSANRSGRPPARFADDVVRQLGNQPDAILCDDAAVGGGAASSVVEITEEGLIVHREGAIGAEEIRRVAGVRLIIRSYVEPGRPRE